MGLANCSRSGLKKMCQLKQSVFRTAAQHPDPSTGTIVPRPSGKVEQTWQDTLRASKNCTAADQRKKARPSVEQRLRRCRNRRPPDYEFDACEYWRAQERLADDPNSGTHQACNGCSTSESTRVGLSVSDVVRGQGEEKAADRRHLERWRTGLASLQSDAAS